MGTDNPMEMIYAPNPRFGESILSQSDDHQETVITVRTFEPVTPAFLAYRIAQACGGSALREGESVSADGLEFTVGPPQEFTWPTVQATQGAL